MMSSAASASASASKPEKKIAVWGYWSGTNRDAYLPGKHFNITTNKTIADLKNDISEYISGKYEPGYKLPALTKMKPYTKRPGIHPDFWVADDTPIGHLIFNDLEINLPK
jgi:hypothetical protein